MKIAEKVVVSRTPDTVRINLGEVPKHEISALCRVVLQGVAKAFQNPQFAAEYERWLAEKEAGTDEGTA